jgi:alanine racemase
MNGYKDGYIKSLPTRQVNSYHPESILDIQLDNITLKTSDGPVRLRQTNVHLLNKIEIEDHYDRFMEIYG